MDTIAGVSPGAKIGILAEPLWTVGDVARYLRLEPETIRTMSREGKLPAIKVGRVWRYQGEMIRQWLVHSNGA